MEKVASHRPGGLRGVKHCDQVGQPLHHGGGQYSLHVAQAGGGDQAHQLPGIKEKILAWSNFVYSHLSFIRNFNVAKNYNSFIRCLRLLCFSSLLSNNEDLIPKGIFVHRLLYDGDKLNNF